MKPTRRSISPHPAPPLIPLAIAMAGSALAVSPYEVPYGIQWNYLVGAAGDDGGGSSITKLDVVSDGTVFVNNRTGFSTWGSGTGGNVRGGVGAISPLGNLLYGTTITSLPTMNAGNQQYAAGVSAAGNKAYFAVYGAQTQYWTGEDGKDPNRAMVWSLDSSGLGSIADQHSLSKFTGATGNPPRADLLQPTTTGLTPAAGQNRINGSDLRDSTLDLVMVMDMVDGDFGTAGDYEGKGLRTRSGAIGRDSAYLPGIGVYNFTSNTLSGPAKQPILTFDTSADVFEVFTIQCVADSAGSLNNKFFDVAGFNGNYRFWYSVNGGGTAPANPPNPNGGRYQIDIATDATADAVAAATQAVIDAQAAFVATAVGGVVTVTLADPGNSTQTNSGATGFTFTEVTPGFKVTGSNMGSYNVAAIDQSTGRYYGGGISHSRAESTSTAWDPDASGPAPSIPFVTSTSSGNPAGIGTAYDAAHNLLYSVTWDTPGYDIINTIATTNDGSNGTFWAGEKLDDCHIELRDASGAVVWFDTFDMSPSVGVERISRARVDASGDLWVTGYFENGGAGGGTSAYDTFVRKYDKTGPAAYSLEWSKTIGLAGVQDLVSDSALDASDQTLYVISATWGQWPNTTGFVRTDTNNDLLVQKLTPGDFNTDGLVDFTDVQIAGTATKPGLTGVDTYDFNGDGDSTLTDTTFMITEIMDRVIGDIAQDALVTDVDNADIGKAIGASGSGTLYLDGDLDWDGDVDGTDITAVVAAFTGASSPAGYGGSLGTGATLRYRASDGQVWLHADEAAGDIITSFQLENVVGSFIPGSFTGPTGGGFGGALQQATPFVLADTDTTLAGAAGTGGLISLGTVFPSGMDLPALQAYLKTAVYTGQPGSGQMRFNLVVGNILSPFEVWAQSFTGLTNPYSNIDFDAGGLETGIEWVVGGDPTLGGDDSGNRPVLNNSDPNYFKFVFRRRDAAAADAGTTIQVEYGSNLTGWRNTTTHGVTDGVLIDDSVDLGGGFHQVTVSIPKSLAAGGRIFARLDVGGLPASLLDEDFEDDNGGFTVNTVGGTAWAHGVVNTTEPPEGAVTAGNSGTRCWGTNLTGGYTAGTDTSLRSPVIDLTGVTAARLTFAMAVDSFVGHNITVNVIDDTTDSVIANIIPATGDPSGSNANWATIGPVAIPAAAFGQPVRIEWRFVGNGDGSYNGVYIDDVVVTSP